MKKTSNIFIALLIVASICTTTRVFAQKKPEGRYSHFLQVGVDSVKLQKVINYVQQHPGSGLTFDGYAARVTADRINNDMPYYLQASFYNPKQPYEGDLFSVTITKTSVTGTFANEFEEKRAGDMTARVNYVLETFH